MSQNSLFIGRDSAADVAIGIFNRYADGIVAHVGEDLQHYCVVDLLRRRQFVTNDMGNKFIFTLTNATGGNAGYTAPFDTRTNTITNRLIQGSIGMVLFKTGAEYDTTEKNFQHEDSIVDIVASRIKGEVTDLYEFMEAALWDAPTGPTQDPPEFLGIPHWLLHNSAATGDAARGEFYNANPSGFTAGRAGINSTTEDGWRNWSFIHDNNLSSDQFVQDVARAMDFTRFQPAHEREGEKPKSCEIYSKYLTRQKYQAHVKALNDNVGTDGVQPYTGDPVLSRSPWKWAPQLDADSTYDDRAPIFGVNWGVMKLAVQENYNMVAHPPIVPPDQPTVVRQFYTHGMNLFTDDLRQAGFVADLAA